MKGFGIEIKNTLLDPKHVDNMGQAVWLYMFLIDKITSVGEDEIGIVLGRKPITYKEVKEELGISQDTYTRWVAKLEAYPYIQAIRTPHGFSFRVYKAYKKFGKRIRKTSESDSAEMRNHLRKSAESNIRHNRDNTKDIYKFKKVELGDKDKFLASLKEKVA